MIQRFKQLRANKMNRPVNEKLLLPVKNCLFLQSILTLLKVKCFISDMIRLHFSRGDILSMEQEIGSKDEFY